MNKNLGNFLIAIGIAVLLSSCASKGMKLSEQIPEYRSDYQDYIDRGYVFIEQGTELPRTNYVSTEETSRTLASNYVQDPLYQSIDLNVRKVDATITPYGAFLLTD